MEKRVTVYDQRIVGLVYLNSFCKKENNWSQRGRGSLNAIPRKTNAQAELGENRRTIGEGVDEMERGQQVTPSTKKEG